MVDNQVVNRDSKKMWNIILSIAAVVLLCVLVIIKVNNEEFSIGWTIAIGIIIIAFFAVVIFGINFFSRKSAPETTSEDKKLPRAVTVEQATEIAIRAIKNPHFGDYVFDCLGEGIEEHGRGVKSTIYIYKAKGEYEGCTYVILVNMHYPLEKHRVLINPTDLEVEKAKMMLADFPEPDPAKRIITTKNPILGTEQTVEEINPQKEEEKNKSEEEKKL